MKTISADFSRDGFLFAFDFIQSRKHMSCQLFSSVYSGFLFSCLHFLIAYAAIGLHRSPRRIEA